MLSLQQTFGHDDLPQDERKELVSAWEEGIVQVVTEAGGRLAALAAGPTRPGFVGSCVGSDALRRPRRARDGDRVGASPAAGSCSFIRPAAPFPAAHPAGGRPSRSTRRRCRPRTSPGCARGQALWPDVSIVFSILAGGGPFQLERLGSRGVDVRSSSIRTSTSTRRPTAGARSSSASRRSASSRSSTAATCPSSIRNPHFGR